MLATERQLTIFLFNSRSRQDLVTVVPSQPTQKITEKQHCIYDILSRCTENPQRYDVEMQIPKKLNDRFCSYANWFCFFQGYFFSLLTSKLIDSFFGSHIRNCGKTNRIFQRLSRCVLCSYQIMYILNMHWSKLERNDQSLFFEENWIFTRTSSNFFKFKFEMKKCRILTKFILKFITHYRQEIS